MTLILKVLGSDIWFVTSTELKKGLVKICPIRSLKYEQYQKMITFSLSYFKPLMTSIDLHFFCPRDSDGNYGSFKKGFMKFVLWVHE